VEALSSTVEVSLKLSTVPLAAAGVNDIALTVTIGDDDATGDDFARLGPTGQKGASRRAVLADNSIACRF
jgi:hypothetical protein